MENLIVLIQNNEVEPKTIIANRDWFEKKSLSQCYGGFGQTASHEEAGDEPLYSDDQIVKMELLKEKINMAKETESEELSMLEAELEEIVENPESWDLNLSVLGYTYHDGHHFKTVTIQSDYNEPDFNEVDEETSILILKQWEEKEVMKTQSGVKTYESENYLFHKSFWQGAWEMAVVEEK